MPGISVILPVRQGEDDLRECVESVRAQTFGDWELIVVDDGSTDDTEEVCKALATEDARIRVFRRKKSGGVNEARNVGLNEAKGDFVIFLDVKDRYEPFALETMWSAAQEADTVGFACSVPGGGERVTVSLGKAGLYEKEAIRATFVTPLFAQRLRVPVMGGQVWRWVFSAKLLRDGNLSFRGKYLPEELFTLEYLCLSRRLAVTEQVLCRRGAGAPVGYRKDLLRGGGPELKNGAARKDGVVDVKIGVFRGGGDEGDAAVLDKLQQGLLLLFVKILDLVQIQQCTGGTEKRIGLRCSRRSVRRAIIFATVVLPMPEGP